MNSLENPSSALECIPLTDAASIKAAFEAGNLYFMVREDLPKGAFSANDVEKLERAKVEQIRTSAADPKVLEVEFNDPRPDARSPRRFSPATNYHDRAYFALVRVNEARPKPVPEFKIRDYSEVGAVRAEFRGRMGADAQELADHLEVSAREYRRKQMDKVVEIVRRKGFDVRLDSNAYTHLQLGLPEVAADFLYEELNPLLKAAVGGENASKTAACEYFLGSIKDLLPTNGRLIEDFNRRLEDVRKGILRLEVQFYKNRVSNNGATVILTIVFCKP